MVIIAASSVQTIGLALVIPREPIILHGRPHASPYSVTNSGRETRSWGDVSHQRFGHDRMGWVSSGV